MPMTPLLEIDELTIGFGNARPVVKDVSFSVAKGQTVALVGESGSGKTLTCRSILRILPDAAQLRSGSVWFAGPTGPVDLLGLSERKLRAIRGNRISMIFQEPMRSLSPLHRLGNQVVEVLQLHRDIGDREAKARVVEQFEKVGFADPERAWKSYPFEMSGGMQQRAMIAMAMVAKPEVLIADEPTTALDVTTQAQVLGLIRSLQAETGMAVILVTHDLGVVANMAQHVVVMNQGRVMEAGTAAQVLGQTGHGYTAKLLAAAPVIPEVAKPVRIMRHNDVIFELKNISKTYTMKSGRWSQPIKVTACRDINLQIVRGQTLAVVGESGSGKSTCARIALGAEHPEPGGEVLFRSSPTELPLTVHTMSVVERTAFQRQAQMIFQDPYSSLSPRMRIRDALTEPMEIHKTGNRRDRLDRAAEMLGWVGLDPAMMNRYPHAFSGGQRQRLSIARALTLGPKLLICDEPTSALDVSVQDQILTLLEDIRDRMGLSYLFISHDLAVVARIADKVAVMREGIIVEQAAPANLFHNPQHPYTKALIAAHPEPNLARLIDMDLVAAGAGDPSTWADMFRFEGRMAPALRELELGHLVRCHV